MLTRFLRIFSTSKARRSSVLAILVVLFALELSACGALKSASYQDGNYAGFKIASDYSYFKSTYHATINAYCTEADKVKSAANNNGADNSRDWIAGCAAAVTKLGSNG
jgi:hypothetical protein